MPDPIAVSIANFRERLASLGFESYGSYLRSEHWRSLREQYVGRSCAFCRSPFKELHHASYERLGEEQAADLLPVCVAHHQEIHAYARERGCTVATASVAVRSRYVKAQKKRRRKQAARRQGKARVRRHRAAAQERAKDVGTGNPDPLRQIRREHVPVSATWDPEMVRKYGAYLAQQSAKERLRNAS